MELREIFDFGKLGIITEKAKLPKYALAKLNYNFARADMRNANFRTYSESILSKEVSRKSEELRTQKIPGMLNHPISGITELDKIAHVLTGVSYDRNTKLASAESYVLDTSKGRDFMTMMQAELAMGCSMRGFGNVKNGYVQSDWKFDTVDFVLRPSFSDAMIDKSNIIESANNIFDEKGNNKGGDMKNLMGLSQEYVDEMTQDCYKICIDEGTFKGSLEDYKKENGRFVLAAILLEEGKFETIEEALTYVGADKDSNKQINALDKEAYLGATEMGFHGTQEEFEESLSGKTSNQELTEEAIDAKIMSFFNEAISSGFKGDLAQFKEKYPTIVESAPEVKIVVEKKVEPEESFKSKATWGEIKLSGYEGTMQEHREKFPNIEIMIEEAPEKIAVEKVLTEKTLKEEAGRIFTALSQDNPNSQLTLEDVKKMLEVEEEKKIDKRILKKAIAIVSHDISNSGADVSEEKLEKMVKAEVERLTEERKLRRQKNWQAYQKLLD